MLAILFTTLFALTALAEPIHPGGNAEVCLEAKGATNGAEVFVAKCNGKPTQDWAIKAGSTKVQLVGQNFCIDAGTTPGNGIKMKVWQCYDGLAAQQWFLTGDGRVAVEGKGQCLDLPGGVINDGTVVQTWECATGNTNQFWTVGKNTPPPSSSSVPPSCNPTATITVTATPTPKARREIRYQH